MSSIRAFRLPLTLLALAIAGGVAIFSVDLALFIAPGGDDYEEMRFQSDIRTFLAVVLVVSCIWLATMLALRSHARIVAVIRESSAADAATQPIPRIRIVGTAVVDKAPPPAQPAYDPKVIELGKRIARQIADD